MLKYYFQAIKKENQRNIIFIIREAEPGPRYDGVRYTKRVQRRQY